MNIDDNFIRPLKELLDKMGAVVSENTAYSGVALDPLEQLREELERGRDIEIEEVSTDFGGLLSFEDQQIILYIYSTHDSKEKLLHRPETSVKFHVSWCVTLQRMQNANRSERYVASTKKSGEFRVEWEDPDTHETGVVDAKLAVCRSCLDYLALENFSIHGMAASDKDRVVKEFNIEGFFREYSTFFNVKPKFTDITTPAGGYVKDWSKISEAYRASKNWNCEKCRVDLSNDRRLLHVHHKNGRREENFKHNLEALCALCHSQEPMHSHMQISEVNKLQIIKCRRSQELM